MILLLALACAEPASEPPSEPEPEPARASAPVHVDAARADGAATVGAAASDGAPSGRTRVVMLGTGTPIPDPERSGPSLAVVVDDVPYLVDMGPGVVRRAAAAERSGIRALSPVRLGRVFVTHLHSDHTAGLPDLWLTPWVVGRQQPLHVHGPPGVAAMTEHIREAWAADLAVRIEGAEGKDPRGAEIVAHEIAEAGVVYRDPRVTVTAVPVPHGSWPHAFAYRFETPDRVVVVSGDTAPSEAIAAACDGCDLLVHEVYSQAAFEMVGDRGFAAYHGTFHTSTTELAALAAQARPKRLLLYHQLYMGATDRLLVEEVRRRWDGEVVSARDLGVY